MSVEVKFFANFREILGYKEIDVSVGTVRELLERLSDENKELAEKLFKDKEKLELNKSVNIMVNGRSTEHLDGIDTELGEGDTVAVFPPVAGG